MNAHWTDRLSEYLDGDLDGAEHAACESHLATCAECARTLEDLKAVAGQARALGSMAPDRDLWPAIERRLDGPRALTFGGLGRRRWTLSLPQALAAAAALVAVTGAITWLATSGRLSPAGRSATGDSPLARATAPPRASAPAPGAATNAARSRPARDAEGQIAAEPADFGTAEYDAAIASLEASLRQHRDRLDPRTVEVVERNLAVIDAAIREARAALASDPASPYLNAHLASTMRRKVELLKRAAKFAGDRI